jgi:hypothetical protein
MKIPTSYTAAIAALLVLIVIICPQLAHAGISHVHTPCGVWTVITYPGSPFYVDGFDPWGWYHHGHIKSNGEMIWEY